MKILLVTETLAAGGAETFVLRLTRKLRELGHQCDLLCLNRDFVDERLVAQFPDVNIIRLPLPILRSIKRFDRLLKAIRIDWSLQAFLSARWIGRHLLGRYDVFHTNLFGADWLFETLRARYPDLRQVSTLHGDYGLYESGIRGTERTVVLDWRQKITRLIRNVDRWVYIADDQKRLFERAFRADPARLVKIYNGYPARPAHQPSIQPATRFIMVARGMREKGWSELLDAFAMLSGNARLTLVGEGGCLREMEVLHGRDSRIEFTGFHPSPIDLIEEADVFVLPTTYKAESLPTVIIEALACGKPVIATDIGEVANMLRAPDGESAGALLEFKDGRISVSELASAMQRMIDDRDLRLRQSDVARQAFAKFDMDECARRYVEIYEAAGAS